MVSEFFGCTIAIGLENPSNTSNNIYLVRGFRLENMATNEIK
jgi:hypothetical protein